MKQFIYIFVLLSVLSCSHSPWSKEDKKAFLTDCITEGGSKSYCECYMENVMQQYPIKEDANTMDFETKIELSKDCE